VLDVRPALYQNVDELSTRQKTTRMLLHAKLNDYVFNLRNESFPVTVNEDVLAR